MVGSLSWYSTGGACPPQRWSQQVPVRKTAALVRCGWLQGPACPAAPILPQTRPLPRVTTLTVQVRRWGHQQELYGPR